MLAIAVLFVCLSLAWSPQWVTAEECVLRPSAANPANFIPTAKNPYGMVVIPKTYGLFHKNDLLVSGWNSADNLLFGQGNNITHIRNRAVVRTITITKNEIGVCEEDEVNGSGMGFTMGMAWLGNGYVLQCSTPINKPTDPAVTSNADGNAFPAHPGCCLVINNEGHVVASFRRNGINGPWGATTFVRESNEQVIATLFLSNVLGPLNAPNQVNNGVVTRYTFVVPSCDSEWVSGPSNEHTGTLGRFTTIATNIASTPVSISGGTVGPSGLVYSPAHDKLFVSGTVSGGAQGTIFAIPTPLSCALQLSSGSTSICHLQTFVSCGTGVCNGPIGINLTPTPIGYIDLLVANGQDGNLVQYRQTGDLICTTVADQTGVGTLFNMLSVPIDENTAEVHFVDDALNEDLFLNPFSIYHS